jgi:vacuolar-type H+-ATPase subunit I/STV1
MSKNVLNIFDRIRNQLADENNKVAQYRRAQKERAEQRRAMRDARLRSLREHISEIYDLIHDQRYVHYRTMLEEMRDSLVRRIAETPSNPVNVEAAAQLKLVNYLLDYPDYILSLAEEDK